MRALLATTVALAAAASTAQAKTYLLEQFEGDSFEKDWVASSWKPDMGQWDTTRCVGTAARLLRVSRATD